MCERNKIFRVVTGNALLFVDTTAHAEELENCALVKLVNGSARGRTRLVKASARVVKELARKRDACALFLCIKTALK